mmetsp:Transcript_14060/g.12416  ORF Transcript_14060/g.12416 Transcript_14060/m.12416 type:complete len:100 (+) Transcript_14060:1-300(+)
MQSAVIGLLLTALGSISTAFGWAFQKQAFNKVNNTERSIFKTWHWWVGLFFIIFTQPLYLVGISMVNQSTTGVVGPISIIINMFLAKFYLKESIRRMEI